MKKAKSKGEQTLMQNYTKSICLATGLGIVCTIIVLFSFSIIMSFTDIPQMLVEPMAILSIAVGGYVSGYICSRINKEKGFFLGLVCGLIIFIIILISSLWFMPKSFGPILFVKLFSILLCSGIGGIVGVNKKQVRR